MDIRRAASLVDFLQAAIVLDEQRAWLEAIVGADLATVQPAAAAEYAAPERVYVPPRGALVLAVEGDEPVGVAGVKVLGERRCELKRTYVRPRYRGRGAGAALVREAIAAAGDLGCDRIVLDTDPASMTQAHELYRRLGFREIPPLDEWDVPTATGMELDLRERSAAA